jgi:hypothetical protein
MTRYRRVAILLTLPSIFPWWCPRAAEANPQDSGSAESQRAGEPHESLRKIHVVVVAVPQFAIADYNSDVLQSAFSERCSSLKDYFEQHFGKDNVEVHQYCTTESTTRESLRHLFSIDVPRFSANTLTLIFIMSHGESAQFGNKFLSSDLELITSDTSTSDVEGDLKGERQFSSILFGSELMAWLQRVPAGSTILMFLDTCHSGAAASFSTSLMVDLQQQFGLRASVFASSLPQDVSYKALFTKELMELWDGESHCLNQDTLPNDILRKMSQEAPVAGTEGLPYFVVRYNGPVCLGNFGKDRRLLFLYAGQDAEVNPFQYDISEDLGTSQRMIISDQLQYVYLPVPLDAKKYIVNVRRSNQVIGKWSIDLTSDASRLLWFDPSSATPQNVAKFGETMADTAEANGSPSQAVVDLKQRAVAVYRAAGFAADADRLQGEMKARGQIVTFSETAQSLAFMPKGAIKNALTAAEDQGDGSNTVTVARELELLGDFSSAAIMLQDAASKETNPEKKAHLASDAYVASLSAGDVKGAKKIQQQYGTPADVHAIIAAPTQNTPIATMKATGLAAVLDRKGPT